MIKYLLISFIVLPLIICCKEEIQANSEVHSGYIIIRCEVGPYYLDLDSLKNNCGSAIALPEMLSKARLDSIHSLELIVDNACSMDQIKDKLGNSNLFDLKLERAQTLNSIELTTSFNSSPIPLELDGTSLSDPATDYPFMGGYEIDLNPGTLRIYMLNIWIGGCLHDMIIWEMVDG